MPTNPKPDPKPMPAGDPLPGEPAWNPEPAGDPKPDLPPPDSENGVIPAFPRFRAHLSSRCVKFLSCSSPPS